MKAVVIGGGGAFGAITIGNASKLDKDYDYVLGVSTGAIMSVLFALKKWDKLKEAYTTSKNDYIYNIYPFNKKGDLKIYLAVWRSIMGYVSIGEMKPILALVRKWLSEDDYLELKDSGKTVIIALLNVTTGRVEYKYSNDHDYWEFTEYIAAASCPELLGNLWNINGWEYADSGLATLVPIVKATKLPVDDIDIYIHREFKRDVKNSQILDMKVGALPRLFMFSMRIIKAIFRYILIQRENLEYKEQREGILRALIKGKKVTCYYLDSMFRKHNAMVMDSKIMKSMYDYGFRNGMNKFEYNLENWEGLFDPQDDE